jgi:hypothetical protein
MCSKRHVRLLSLGLLLLVPSSALAVEFTQDTWIAAGDTTYDYQPITVTGCVVTIDGAHTFTVLTIQDGGIVTHSPDAAGMMLTILGDVTLDAESRIDVTGVGHAAGMGPGAGGAAFHAAGGGYGGAGGDSDSTAPGGGTYGSITAPVDLGSGGGNGFGTGGAGGGALRMLVGGTLAIDGTISADGGDAIGFSGGGAGGSIWVDAALITGSGSISADGGHADPVYGGGGGGGRVALEYDSSTFNGTISAIGGTGFSIGGAGTVYTHDRIGDDATVTIDNAGQAGAATELVDPPALAADVFVQGGAFVAPPRDGGTVSLGVIGDIRVAIDGAISADSRGYAPGEGPGAGVDAYHAGGAGHAGAGGDADEGAAGGSTYGSFSAPVTLGSGGGVGFGSGGAGGGAIRLALTGDLIVDGRVSADGDDATGYSGGGAGGSVWIQAASLSGSGRISASGGAGGGATLGGGGGAGRVALYLDTPTTWSIGGGDQAAQTLGGGGHIRGGAGTVWLAVANAQPQLVIDADDEVGAHTELSGDVLIDGDLVVRNGARLGPPARHTDLHVTVDGDVSIAGDAALTADGCGYGPSDGPGGGHDGYHAGGGGFGGAGGTSDTRTAGGGCYGDIVQPAALGSGGGNGFGSGGAGGGTLRLTVTPGHLLVIDGAISADGLPGSGYSGGGAGGSVWINAESITGNGTITANGGSAHMQYAGGGGGGRVSLFYEDFTPGPQMRVEAIGGAGQLAGGAGTFYAKRPQDDRGTLIIHNDNQQGAATEFSGHAELDMDVLVGPGAIVGPPTGVAGLHLDVAGDLHVTTSGAVSADGRGYAAGGPNPGGAGHQAGGGGHAGAGGTATSAAPGGGCHGDVIEPTTMGSGGGADPDGGLRGGAGGGAIRLSVAGSLNIDGRISADGEPYDDDIAGGGAGGSLWIAAPAIIGGGAITARGGNAASDCGGGGGGRIMIEIAAGDLNDLDPIVTHGGSGQQHGGAGTVYLRTPLTPFDQLIIDNNNTVGAATEFSNATVLPADVTVRGGAVISHPAGFVGGMALSILGDMTIADGAAVSAFGRGYAPGSGPGAGGSGTSGGGGGHGGAGGQSASGANGGGTYDDPNAPIELGSGGGNAGGGAGGGAIQLDVGGVLTVDGTLAVDGADATDDSSGGGAGGSLIIDAGYLVGDGAISASGGDGGASGGGGGGAGLIAIVSNCEPGVDDQQVRAQGGAGHEPGASASLSWSIKPDVDTPGCGFCELRRYVNQVASGAETGLTWDDAFVTIDAALAAANSAAYGDGDPDNDCVEIWVAEGTYTPTTRIDPDDPRSATYLLLTHVQLYGGFDADDPGENCADRDWASNVTVLSGDLNGDDGGGHFTDNAYHVIRTFGWPQEGVVDGFVIQGGVADGGEDDQQHGGGIFGTTSRFQINNSVLLGNQAAGAGGGLYACCATLDFENVALGTNDTGDDDIVGVFCGTSSELDGDLYVNYGRLDFYSVMEFSGPGTLWLADDTLLGILGDGDVHESIVSASIRGLGDIFIDQDQTLVLDSGCLVDLSSMTPGDPGACADFNSADGWGGIYVAGNLVVRGAEVRNTNIEVITGGVGVDSFIYRNDIALLNDPALPPDVPGYGGEFFVEGGADILCNIIHADGDRYMDLDPNPSLPPAERPNIGTGAERNRIYVTVRQGLDSGQGELLELRTQDFDIDDTNYPGSGCFNRPYAPGSGYDDAWALEQLTLERGARVTLTNRPGFDFTTTDPGDPIPEAMYVRHLVLRPNSVLNAGLQRLYYDELIIEEPEPGEEYGYITNYPLLGYSLKVIASEDDTEFDVRVQTRTTDPADPVPAQPPYYAGSVERVTDPWDPGNGIMVMRTRADGALSARSVAAVGSFARAAEDNVIVKLQYRFCHDPATPPSPDTALYVYLSETPGPRDASVDLEIGACDADGDPNDAADTCCVAIIRPPQPGRPGSPTHPGHAFATFSVEYERHPDLDLTAGAYVELELRGADACVHVDNWDPAIPCSGFCFDLTGGDSVTMTDFLVLMSELGRDVAGVDGSNKHCLDARFGPDAYVDLVDLIAWDAVLSQDGVPGDFCGPPPPNYDGDPGTPIPTGDIPPDGVLITGKRGGENAYEDGIYAFRSYGAPIGTAPWSSPAIFAARSNVGLYQAPGRGVLYQLHSIEGLIQLDTAERRLEVFQDEFTPAADVDHDVYIGPQATYDALGYPDGYPDGYPILDIAFHPTDPDVIYVVPAIVDSVHTPAYLHPHYRAAARVTGTPTTGLAVTQLYGTDPCDDVFCQGPGGGDPPCHEGECVARYHRQVEVDGQGHVLVLSASASSPENDFLLRYDEQTGEEIDVTERIVLNTLHAQMRNPSHMLISQVDPTTLYLACDYDPNYPLPDPPPDPLPAPVTRIYRCTLDWAPGHDPLTIDAIIDITPPLPDPDLPGLGYGHHALITAMTEDPATGDLYVAGTLAERVADDLPVTDPLYMNRFCDTCGLFTVPTLARIPAGSTGPIVARRLPAHDAAPLAYPLGVVFLGASPIEPGDVNLDGIVDVEDFMLWSGCMAGPGNPNPGCDPLHFPTSDLDGDGDADLHDFAAFQRVLPAP